MKDYIIRDLDGRNIGRLMDCTISPNGVVWHCDDIVAILHTPMESALVTCSVEEVNKL